MKIVRVIVLVLVLCKVVLVVSGVSNFYTITEFGYFDKTDFLWLLIPLTIAIVLFCTVIVLDNACDRGVIDRKWSRFLKLVILLIPLSGLVVMPLFRRMGR